MVGVNIPLSILDAAFVEGESPRVPKGVFPMPLPRRLSSICTAALNCVAALVSRQGAGILQLPVVYASRYGELERTHALFEEWKEYGEMSPAGFSISVHNATASLLGLASHNQNNSTTLAAGQQTIGMGLLEAAMFSRESGTPCLMVYADGHPDLKAAALLVQHGGDKSIPLSFSFAGLIELWNTSCHE